MGRRVAQEVSSHVNVHPSHCKSTLRFTRVLERICCVQRPGGEHRMRRRSVSVGKCRGRHFRSQPRAARVTCERVSISRFNKHSLGTLVMQK